MSSFTRPSHREMQHIYVIYSGDSLHMRGSARGRVSCERHTAAGWRYVDTAGTGSRAIRHLRADPQAADRAIAAVRWPVQYAQ